MFIRIKKRPLVRTRVSYRRDYSLRLLIVESYRKDGQPRQRIIRYLGSTHRSTLRHPVMRKRFLQLMEKKLDALRLNIRDITSLKLSLIRNLSHII